MTRIRKHPGTMTARQFAKAAKQANVTAVKLARARRVLVDGETVREVADSDGVTTHVVYGEIYVIRPRAAGMPAYWPGMSPMGG